LRLIAPRSIRQQHRNLQTEFLSTIPPTVEPTRIVLSGPQVLGCAHHSVDGRIACGEVCHRGRVQVAVRRHHVRGVVSRTVRTLGDTGHFGRHVTKVSALNTYIKYKPNYKKGARGIHAGVNKHQHYTVVTFLHRIIIAIIIMSTQRRLAVCTTHRLVPIEIR